MSAAAKAAGKGDEASVEHDAGGRRFVARLPDGDAELAYVQHEDGVLELHHTFVPDSARGRGVGDALVEAAVAHARTLDVRIVPTCPFVRGWLEKHPEARRLIAER